MARAAGSARTSAEAHGYTYLEAGVVGPWAAGCFISVWEAAGGGEGCSSESWKGLRGAALVVAQRGGQGGSLHLASAPAPA